MEGKYNFEKMLKYPHLLGEDIPVWNRFIELYPDRFNTVDYDIHVGTGIEAPEEPVKTMADQWRYLTQKRIDVIGWKNNLPTIIEVKYRVGLDTLGQVLGYRFLYMQLNPEILGIPLLVICAMIGPDDISVFKHYNVSHLIV